MRGTATPGEERLLAGYEPRGRGFESCQPRQKPFNNGLDACGAKPFFSARLLASHPSLNCSPRAEAWCGRTSPGPCWPPPPHARSWQWRSASPGSASRPWCLGAGGRKRGHGLPTSLQAHQTGRTGRRGVWQGRRGSSPTRVLRDTQTCRSGMALSEKATRCTRVGAWICAAPSGHTTPCEARGPFSRGQCSVTKGSDVTDGVGWVVVDACTRLVSMSARSPCARCPGGCMAA
jgi:hypothetical protein